MVHAGMDAAIGLEAHEVEGRPALAGVGDGSEEGRVLEKAPVLDRLVDPEDVLLDDPARPEIEVSYLGVAHLACAQADRAARGIEGGVRVLVPQLVEDGRPGQRDRVSLPRLAQAPPVEDDQPDPVQIPTLLRPFETNSPANPTASVALSCHFPLLLASFLRVFSPFSGA